MIRNAEIGTLKKKHDIPIKFTFDLSQVDPFNEHKANIPDALTGAEDVDAVIGRRAWLADAVHEQWEMGNGWEWNRMYHGLSWCICTYPLLVSIIQACGQDSLRRKESGCAGQELNVASSFKPPRQRTMTNAILSKNSQVQSPTSHTHSKS